MRNLTFHKSFMENGLDVNFSFPFFRMNEVGLATHLDKNREETSVADGKPKANYELVMIRQ